MRATSQPIGAATAQQITEDEESRAEDDIQKLTEWIRQGANYAKHWSYEPPVRPPVPTVKNTS